MGDHVAVVDVGTEVDIDGDRAVGGTAALLAEHGERAGVVSAAAGSRRQAPPPPLPAGSRARSSVADAARRLLDCDRSA